MPLMIPPAPNYPSPLVAVPSVWQNETPREGSRMVSCEVDWGSMGGASQCVNFNLQNNATLEFSQIAGLKVDNSQCGADVQFIFPDTGDTITIPAFSPADIFPVFSNQTQFFLKVLNTNAQSEDVTRFIILNTLPPPVSVPVSTAQDAASPLDLVMAAGTTALVLAGVNGTLQGLNVSVSVNDPTNVFQMNIQVEDGNGAIIASFPIGGQAGASINAMMISLTPINIRFNNGINIVQSGTAPSGSTGVLGVNAVYRIP